MTQMHVDKDGSNQLDTVGELHSALTAYGVLVTQREARVLMQASPPDCEQVSTTCNKSHKPCNKTRHATLGPAGT